jgi:hypothetical protein
MSFTRCAGWLRCNALRYTGCDARGDALRAGCSCRLRRRNAFDGGIFRVGFFWDRLNVHTFNCHHRTDRRVEDGVYGMRGWVGGGMGGRRNGWLL